MATGKSRMFAPRSTGWMPSFTCRLLFAGFSFGAAVGLRAACADARVKAVDWGGSSGGSGCRRYRRRRELIHSISCSHCAKPKLFVSGARDQFGPRR